MGTSTMVLTRRRTIRTVGPLVLAVALLAGAAEAAQAYQPPIVSKCWDGLHWTAKSRLRFNRTDNLGILRNNTSASQSFNVSITHGGTYSYRVSAGGEASFGAFFADIKATFNIEVQRSETVSTTRGIVVTVPPHQTVRAEYGIFTQRFYGGNYLVGDVGTGLHGCLSHATDTVRATAPIDKGYKIFPVH